MKNTKIANRYAKALFDLALEKEVLDQVKDDMELVALVCQQNKEFRRMLQSPIIYTGKKEAIMKALFENKLQQMSFFFLLIITRKKREAVLEAIANQFVIIYKEFKNITTATLGTAIKLDKTIFDKVSALLGEQTKGEIELLEEIDKDLIGGFILSYDDKQYDASIKKQIKELRRNFDKNLYIQKIFNR